MEPRAGVWHNESVARRGRSRTEANQDPVRLPMRNLSTNSRNQGFAEVARASYACVMPAAPWSLPTILVATGHKPGPRRHRVTLL